MSSVSVKDLGGASDWGLGGGLLNRAFSTGNPCQLSPALLILLSLSHVAIGNELIVLKLIRFLMSANALLLLTFEKKNFFRRKTAHFDQHFCAWWPREKIIFI